MIRIDGIIHTTEFEVVCPKCKAVWIIQLGESVKWRWNDSGNGGKSIRAHFRVHDERERLEREGKLCERCARVKKMPSIGSTGLDDGPYLPGQAPRKKPPKKTPEEESAIRLRAWETRRAKKKDAAT